MITAILSSICSEICCLKCLVTKDVARKARENTFVQSDIESENLIKLNTDAIQSPLFTLQKTQNLGCHSQHQLPLHAAGGFY